MIKQKRPPKKRRCQPSHDDWLTSRTNAIVLRQKTKHNSFHTENLRISEQQIYNVFSSLVIVSSARQNPSSIYRDRNKNKRANSQSYLISGAGMGSRTPILSLGRIHNSRYTIPAGYPLLYHISLNMV